MSLIYCARFGAVLRQPLKWQVLFEISFVSDWVLFFTGMVVKVFKHMKRKINMLIASAAILRYCAWYICIICSFFFSTGVSVHIHIMNATSSEYYFNVTPCQLIACSGTESMQCESVTLILSRESASQYESCYEGSKLHKLLLWCLL